MPIAVLDLDFQQLPPVICSLPRYDHALILVRYDGEPIGRVLVPVTEGRIDREDIVAAMAGAAGLPLWMQWLHSYLGWERFPTCATAPESATVAVCTRDLPEGLKRCLEAVMMLPDDGQEVLVVDNCPSAEDARHVVEGFTRVRYVLEERSGLNVARNRALREANRDVVAFIDHDAVPDRGWLRALLRNFAPLVLCVTGLTMPLELETDAQQWFERYSSHGRGLMRQVYQGIAPSGAARVGVGANMALRRSVLQSIGPFDETIGAGTATRSADDLEMFARILAAGYRIVYDPAALAWHCHSRTRQQVRQVLYGYGVGMWAFWTQRLLGEHDPWAVKTALGWFGRVQFPALIRSVMRQPDGVPLDLIVAQLLGCAVGPWAYLLSRLPSARQARVRCPQ